MALEFWLKMRLTSHLFLALVCTACWVNGCPTEQLRVIIYFLNERAAKVDIFGPNILCNLNDHVIISCIRLWMTTRHWKVNVSGIAL